MSFGWHGLLGSHSSRDRLGICKQNAQQTRAGDKGSHKNGWREKKKPAMGIYIHRNTSRFAAAKGPFAAAKPYYATVKGSSLRRRTEPRSCESGFTATDQKVWS